MSSAEVAIEAIEVGGSDTAAPLNLRKRVDLIARWSNLDGARVLDAGCGAGEYVEAMGQRGADAHGIEFVEEKVSQWQLSHPGDTRVRRGDLAGLAFSDNTFDIVLLNEVIEHVPDDNLALREIFRVLKPGGTFAMFSPNRFHPFETHGVYARKDNRHIGVSRTFLLPYVPLALGARFVRYWSRNYWPAELAAMTRRAGFGIAHHGFVWQTFENISGNHSAAYRRIAPWARGIAAFAERVPLLRRLGVSQLIVARKPA